MLALRRTLPVTRKLTRSLSTPIQKLSDDEVEKIHPMIRVDQSGEVGAYYIYKGQMAVLGHDPKLKPLLEEMWDQERVHLELFSDLVGEHRVRPSLLRPVWEVAGFVVGAGTALMGKEAAMACTEAVETVIGEHYNDQLRDIAVMDNSKPQIEYLAKVRVYCLKFFFFFFLVFFCHFL
jgi:ubiquinone biosynthesis monooxygenase Coq7